MTKRKEIESNWWQRLKSYASFILTLLSVGGIGYGVACWRYEFVHRAEIMEIRQEYNIQITNLKIDYNNRIIELQNEIKIYELHSQEETYEK